VDLMIVLLIAISAVAISAPVVAAVLVSMASRYEDAAWTLGDQPPGRICAAGRRLVDFHTRGIEWPQPDDRAWAREREPQWEDFQSPEQVEPEWALPAAR
jgi:hypothetical protein